MSNFIILWADAQPPEEVAFAQSLLPAGFEVIAPATSSHAELLALVERAEAVMTQYVNVEAETIARGSRLRLIQKYGGREDGIDLDAAARADVQVAVMPLRGCIAVAELGMTLILALSKQLIKAHASTSTGAYRALGLTPTATSQKVIAFQWMKLPGLLEIFGKTLGIIGFGEIGSEVAKRARAFGMEVLYNKHHRLPTDIERRLAVTFAAVDDLLTRSDFVLLSAPHTPETESMIGQRELDLMRETAYLVNVSRGGLVDEAALAAALGSGSIAGAGLDVFNEEPVAADSPLLALENVILTPHIGGGTGGAKRKQMSDVLSNIVACANGGQVKNRIV